MSALWPGTAHSPIRGELAVGQPTLCSWGLSAGGQGGTAGRRREAAGATGKVPADAGPSPGGRPHQEQSAWDPGLPNRPRWVSPAHMEGRLEASGNCRPWHLGPYLGAPQERLWGSGALQNLGLLSSCLLSSQVVLRLSLKGGELCGCGSVCHLCFPS